MSEHESDLTAAQRRAGQLLREIREEIERQRAAELDDRTDAALANIARDIEAEARPSVAELTAERFRRPKRGAQ